jgi:hypothetical protein
MLELHELLNLQSDFNQYQYGIGNNLIHYFAHPRIPQPTFIFANAINSFVKRQHAESLDQMRMAPQDVSIFKKRAGLLATNNAAYYIASKEYPAVQELYDFSLIQPCWSILFPLKHYLLHHPETARNYRGLLPFGSEVVKYINKMIKNKPKPVLASPDVADHVFLQQITNSMSDFTGMTTVTINNVMYLEGRKID